MNAFIVGAWDGTHAWAQWEPADAPRGYDIRLRYRPNNEREFGNWEPPLHANRAWIKIATNRATKTAVQAAIAVTPAPGETIEESAWAPALEAKFDRSLCIFEFTASRKPVHYLKGTNFHAQVDGAACSYRLLEEIEVEVGEPVRVGMESVSASGWAQLDHEDHFVIRPSLGLVIRNVEPSRNDLEQTGRDFTEITSEPGGPITMVALKPTDIR